MVQEAVGLGPRVIQGAVLKETLLEVNHIPQPQSSAVARSLQFNLMPKMQHMAHYGLSTKLSFCAVEKKC